MCTHMHKETEVHVSETWWKRLPTVSEKGRLKVELLIYVKEGTEPNKPGNRHH